MSSDFTHLHVHTEHSALDGINKVDELPVFVRDELGQSACAITDHGTLSGAYRFWKSCKKAEIKPIIGLEAYYTVNDRHAKEVDEDGERYYHLILLAQNQTGLKNLFKLSSKAYTEGMYYKPRIDDELLAECSEGLFATSACLGSRSSFLLLAGRNQEAEALIRHHSEIYKDRFFIELQLHEDDEQQRVNKALLAIAEKYSLPLLLTNDAHYTHMNDKILHEQTLCMQTNAVMSDENRFSFGDIKVHMADHDWMAEKARAQGLPYDCISNTSSLASLIDDTSYFNDIRNRYPTYPDLPPGMPSWVALERLAKSSLEKKFNGLPPKEYRDRLNEELKVIKQMGYADYMLIVWEFVKASKELDILMGPGRGSVAGSLVAYAIGITQTDPLEYGLVFSRWLNPGRAARPLVFTPDMKRLIEEECLKAGLGSP